MWERASGLHGCPEVQGVDIERYRDRLKQLAGYAAEEGDGRGSERDTVERRLQALTAACVSCSIRVIPFQVSQSYGETQTFIQTEYSRRLGCGERSRTVSDHHSLGVCRRSPIARSGRTLGRRRPAQPMWGRSGSCSGPERPNITSSNPSALVLAESDSSHLSSTARATGSLLWRASPMPTHVRSLPVYANATLVASRGVSSSDAS